ncbi:MarR family winged helix-turn-helix transcriptional regulator [Iamia sp. SCSIO 61187]|uniref:MarR family winged helix-turn-helix transcriptional regulator n=1 Tax=Iamia sp. SCSIO 61187 TaxID=2722752 RepID=UPI001C633B48|nr:MarR family winged helix-turn-helix transcriptional regulator [Iamia sp. SCSIO 61187]
MARGRSTGGGGGDAAGFPQSSAWERPGFLLWHATMRWQRLATRALEPFGLTHAQFTLLGATLWLEEHGDHPPSQRELSEHATVDAMMTSQVVRALEAAKLIRRTEDAKDARVKRLRCTAKGRRVAVAAVAAVEAVEDEVFGPEGERSPELVGLLQRLADRDAEGHPLRR